MDNIWDITLGSPWFSLVFRVANSGGIQEEE